MVYRKMGPAGSEVEEEHVVFGYEPSLIPAGSEPALDWDQEIVDAVLVSSMLNSRCNHLYTLKFMKPSLLTYT